MEAPKKKWKPKRSKYDYELEPWEQEAAKAIYEGRPLLGEGGIFTDLIQRVMQASLRGEMNHHLSSEDQEGNRRNGYTHKTVKTSGGQVQIATPRDRDGTFEPKIIGKRQRVLNDELDKKILSMIQLGLSYSDISAHMREIYGVETNDALINAVSDSVNEELRAWQTRALEPMYAILWLDAAFFKIKHEGQVRNRAVYTVLGVDMDGYKDVLGMYIEESEGARHWLGVMTDLQQRGVKDILIACTDNLKGFDEAIGAIFPHTEVQGCIVHQMRNSMRYVSYKDLKAVVAGLKAIYKAPKEKAALEALEAFDATWGKRYPMVVESWRRNWVRLTTFLRFPDPLRKLIYTTNIIEGYHAQLRKVTKTKRVFDGDMAVLKLLYLVQQRIAREKWQRPMLNWRSIYLTLQIEFKDRLALHDPHHFNIDQQVVGLPQTPSLKTTTTTSTT
jgi:putative transposase